MKKNKLTNKIYILPFLFILLIIPCCAFHSQIKGLDASARPMDDKKYEVLEDVTEKSSSFRLLWLIPVTPQADYKEAIENAINEKGGDNLIDIQYWHEREYWIVGTVDIYYVKGKVIRYEGE